MKNVGLNELLRAMLENGTDNIETTYKMDNGLEITLDIVMTKAVKNGEVIYEADTENENYETN